MALYELSGEPIPKGSTLVIVLEGWIDAGLAALTAAGHLLEHHPSEVAALFDGEELIDQRARRPMLEIDNGVNLGLQWPEIQLRVGADSAGRPISLLVGPEPDYRWRSFGQAVAELAESAEVRMAVGLGAFPAPAPHTRPIRLAATSPEPSLVTRVGSVMGRIQVPSGVGGLLELTLGAAGIPTATLWARVPHYVSAMPYPPAAAALLEGLSAFAGLDLEVLSLHTAGDASRQKVDELIRQSPEHEAMVRQLEEQLDAAEGNALQIGQIPSGEEIAAELERYLRGEGGGG